MALGVKTHVIGASQATAIFIRSLVSDYITGKGSQAVAGGQPFQSSPNGSGLTGGWSHYDIRCPRSSEIFFEALVFTEL